MVNSSLFLVTLTGYGGFLAEGHNNPRGGHTRDTSPGERHTHSCISVKSLEMAGMASLCPAEHPRMLFSAFGTFFLKDTLVSPRDTRRDTILGRRNFGGHKKRRHGIHGDTQNLERTQKSPNRDTKGHKMRKKDTFSMALALGRGRWVHLDSKCFDRCCNSKI